MLRLRKRFYERYNVPGLPTLAYLWIDTDASSRTINDGPADYIMKQVMFGEGERVNAEIPRDEFVKYFSDPQSPRSVRSWLDPKLVVNGMVTNGTGQVRALGRLAFFHKYREIRAKLGYLVDKVRSQRTLEEAQDKYGLAIDANVLDVIIICSVAGGTGSGMFLDVAFMCRRELTGANVTGYLILPSVFSNVIQNARLYANAYAALKELEYYSLRKDLLIRNESHHNSPRVNDVSLHDFVADWDNREDELGVRPKPIPSPPFDTSYLIDNVALGGGVIETRDKSDLFDIVAENIFLNFSSDAFSRTKDSVRSNVKSYLTTPLFYSYDHQSGYTEVLSQRFSSFGLSKIYVPVDRIRRACGYQLALDLITRWLQPQQLSPAAQEMYLENELAALRLRAGGPMDDFIAALDKTGGGTFGELIAQEVRRWREELHQVITSDKRPNLYAVIPRMLKEFLRKNLDKADSQVAGWGDYLQSIEYHRKAFILDICGESDSGSLRPTTGRIREQLGRWLQDNNVRLDASIEYLKILGRVLSRHADLYLKAKNLCDRKAVDSLDSIKVLLEILREEEAGFIVHRKSLRILVDELCGYIRRHLEARVKGFIHATAIDVINDNIKPYVGGDELKMGADDLAVVARSGLIADLWFLRNELTGIYSQFKERFESFERAEAHLIYENLYRTGMFRAYYYIAQAGLNYPVAQKLDMLETQLLETLLGTQSSGLFALLKQGGREQTLDTIETFCFSRFQELTVTVDALDNFRHFYPAPDERQTHLRRFVNTGSVWLRESTEARTLQQLRRNRADYALIGVSAQNRAKDREIYDDIEALVRWSGFRDILYSPTARADAVFLYTEHAGFPLAHIRDLGRYYHEAYLPLARQGTSLHTDVHDEKFTDILIKTQAEVDHTLRRMRALLVGAILGIVNIHRSQEGTVSLSFIESQHGVATNHKLYFETRVDGVLKRDSDVLISIEAKNAKRRMELSTELRLRFYTILAYEIVEKENPYGFPAGPFAPMYRNTSEGVARYYGLEYKAIEAVVKQEYEQLILLCGSEDSVRDQFKQLYPRLDEFSYEIQITNGRVRVLNENVE
jgi:hypothetical protein